jgi:hypothetical protein
LFSARHAGQRFKDTQSRLKAIEMWWLDDIIVPALLILAVFGFVLVVRLQTKRLAGRTTRTAEDLYPRYADSVRKQRKYADGHGGQWQDDEGQQNIPAKHLMPPSKARRAGR